MKAITLILAVSAFAALALHSEDGLERATMAWVRDPTNVRAIGTNDLKSLNKLMELVMDQDKGAIMDLYSEGHLIVVPNNSKVKILYFDSAENAYRVRIFGSTQEAWFIRGMVFRSKKGARSEGP